MPEINPFELFFNWKLRVMIYSRSGYGKTYLAASAAYVKELCPIYFYGTEKGFLSIKHIIFGTRRIQPVIGRSASDLVALQQVILEPGKYKTVVIDSLTELYAHLMAAYLEKVGRANQRPFQNDRGEIHDKILKLLRFIEGRSQVHVIMTAGDMYTKDKEGAFISFDPDIVGKLTWRAPRFFDVVGRLETRVTKPAAPDSPAQITRVLQVQPYGKALAKDRSPGGRLGAMVSNPTMAKIYRALIGPPTMLPEGPTDDPSLQLDFPVPDHIKRELLARRKARAAPQSEAVEGAPKSSTGEGGTSD